MPTEIPYCDLVWPVSGGCTKHRAGCKHCWAIKTVWRLAHSPHPDTAEKWSGLVVRTKTEHHRYDYDWTGKIKLFHEEMGNPVKRTHPLLRKKPTRYFVNSKSDLFHVHVPDWFIDNVMAVVRACPQHTFLIFTKRYKRAADFISLWELPNIQLIFSASNTYEANLAADLLRKTSVAVKGLSLEPLLEDVTPLNLTGIDQLIIGAESLPGAMPGRRCDEKFVLAAANAGQATGHTKVYVKQVHIVTGGGVETGSKLGRPGYEGKVWTFYRLSRNPKEWPQKLRLREVVKNG